MSQLESVSKAFLYAFVCVSTPFMSQIFVAHLQNNFRFGDKTDREKLNFFCVRESTTIPNFHIPKIHCKTAFRRKG